MSGDAMKLKAASILLFPGWPEPGRHLCTSLRLSLLCDCVMLTVSTIHHSEHGDIRAWIALIFMVTPWSPSLLSPMLPILPLPISHCSRTQYLTCKALLLQPPPALFSLGQCNPCFCPTEALSSLRAGWVSPFLYGPMPGPSRIFASSQMQLPLISAMVCRPSFVEQGTQVG